MVSLGFQKICKCCLLQLFVGALRVYLKSLIFKQLKNQTTQYYVSLKYFKNFISISNKFDNVSKGTPTYDYYILIIMMEILLSKYDK